LEGRRIAVFAPDLVDAVLRRIRRQRTVQQALHDAAWIADISGALTIPVLVQYLQLRERLQVVTLQPEVPDSITWRWSACGSYSASSAYSALLLGLHRGAPRKSEKPKLQGVQVLPLISDPRSRLDRGASAESWLGKQRSLRPLWPAYGVH
jgi:hypothetical protein